MPLDPGGAFRPTRSGAWPSLRALRILDTGPEDRFDRITRLAAALLDAPIALVSLVDQDRQWFKSCHGLDVRETSRDAAFCAHAVHDREPMMVADTFLDQRSPTIRWFSASRASGSMPATRSCSTTAPASAACAFRHPPALPEAVDVARLHDLARLAVREIQETDG